MDNLPLSHKTVLITRPIDQAHSLGQLVKQAGGIPILFPTIIISPIPASEIVTQSVQVTQQFCMAIFISTNAVDYAYQAYLNPQQISLAQLPLCAVGQTTAKRLLFYGNRNVITPELENSEGLLSLPELQASNILGKTIIIFRGKGGRELLGDTLRERGAEIVYAEVYQRTKPNELPKHIAHTIEQKPINYLIATSNETLLNLLDLLPSNLLKNLLNTQLVVFSQRTAQLAQQLGFTSTALITATTDDGGILARLIQHAKT